MMCTETKLLLEKYVILLEKIDKSIIHQFWLMQKLLQLISLRTVNKL